MLGMLRPRRPSASAGLAAAPRLEVALGTESRPPTAVTLLSELLRPEAAPWAESTTADSDRGEIEPVESGVAKEMDGTVLLSAAPVEDTPILGRDKLRADTDEVDVSGAMVLPAEEGVPAFGSMLAVPLSPSTLRFRKPPPRVTLRTVVFAVVVPTPLVAAAAVPPAAAVAPSKAASDTAAPNILVLRMVLPRSTENTINPYFRP